jgi:hypothetical protein
MASATETTDGMMAPAKRKVSNRVSMNALLDIVNARRKGDLRKLCRLATITDDAFANFILSAELGLLPWAHSISAHDFISPELHPSEEELRAVVKSRVGTAEGKAAKALSKFGQMFKQRRLLVGHMFYNEDLTNWHFFYFDQRDLDVRNNHWEHGSHIHLINHLWPDELAGDVWSNFNSGNVQMTGSLHIQFERDMTRYGRRKVNQ